VKKAVPQVQYLDDEPLVDVEQQQPQHASDFDEDWKLIDELVQEGIVMPEEKLENMPGTFTFTFTFRVDNRSCPTLGQKYARYGLHIATALT